MGVTEPDDLQPRPMQRPGGRTEDVRRRVVGATIDILASDGVGGLTVEAVAAESNVARTTIYRRWRTPAGLMLAALREELGPRASRIVDTGSLRGDLTALLRDLRAFLGSAQGRGIMQVAFIAQESGAGITEIQSYWEARFEATSQIVRRAIARGEVDEGTPERFVIELVAAPLYFRVFITHDEVDDAYIDQVVDSVIAAVGARDVQSAKNARARKPTRAKTSRPKTSAAAKPKPKAAAPATKRRSR